jgi:copper chaperone NosL
MVVLTLLCAACRPEPEPILYGKDACEHCKMTIIDPKFGAEIVTSKGKIVKFDALECLVDYLHQHPGHQDDQSLLLTTNMAQPGTLIDAKKATYLKDKAFRSPMGANLASFEWLTLAENNRQSPDAKVLNWAEVLREQQINLAAK